MHRAGNARDETQRDRRRILLKGPSGLSFTKS
jgi:hypothetical protein